MANIQINANKQYSPREVADKGLIVFAGDSKDSHYNHIIKLIQAGRLKANNISLGKKGKPRYRISGTALIEYKKQYES